MKSLVSVIVPVYNRELYIEQCIRSLINQTYKDIEIVVIDDGSTDNSGNICDRMASEDGRIRAIHQNNGGVSHARNVGLSCAQGEFISFVDSDDYVAPDYIEHLYNLLIDNNADISCCDFVNTESRNWKPGDEQGECLICSGRRACEIMLGGQPGKELMLASLWGKLYDAKIVKQYTFPEGKTFEDTATTYKYLYSCRKIAVSTKKLYAYYKNDNGIISESYNEKNEDRIAALIGRAEFFTKTGEKQLSRLAWKFALRFLYADSYANGDRCNDEIKGILSGNWYKGNIPLDIFIICFAYIISPNMYKKIRGLMLDKKQ